MTPTNKLRWYVPKMPPYTFVAPTLQQWWAVFRDGQETPEGEWRELPLVNDNAGTA